MHRRALLASSLSLLFTASQATASGAPKKKGGGPGFTQFPMMSVFTRGNGNRHGTLSLDMGLYSDDAKIVDRIKLYMPRLKDAYVRRLQAYAAGLSASSLVDADYLSTQLQSATDQTLGKTGARVLMGSILLN
jgi:hypothetical protein